MSTLEDHTATRTLADDLDSIYLACDGLLATAALQPRTLPEGFARVEGTYRNHPMHMTISQYADEHWERVTLARLVGVEGTCGVTLCGLPARGQLAPVIGLDLIGLGGQLSLAAIDLSPTDNAYWHTHARPLQERLVRATHNLVKPRPIPDFARESFSGHALVAAVPTPHREAFVQATIDFLASLSTLISSAPGSVTGSRVQQAWRANLQWRRHELENRKEHNALALMFGPEWARNFLGNYFLPTDAGSHSR